MTTLAKKITLQNTLILLALLFGIIFGYRARNFIDIDLLSIFFSFFLLSLIVLRYLRIRKNKNVGRLNKTLNVFLWLSIVLFAWSFLNEIYHNELYGPLLGHFCYPDTRLPLSWQIKYYFSWANLTNMEYGLIPDIMHWLSYLPYLIIVGLLHWAIRVNKELSQEKQPTPDLNKKPK